MHLFIDRAVRCGVGALCLWVLAGCATRSGMALDLATTGQGQAQEAAYLMTVSLDNAYRPALPLQLTVLHIERDGGKTLEDRINVAVHGPQARVDLEGAGQHYLVSFKLPPGQYEILGVSSVAGVFPVVAHFFAPLYAGLQVSDAGVYYLGHLRATVRERQGREFRAGPLFPPVHQMLAGATTGTFDVQLSDAFARDERLFCERFDWMKGVRVLPAVLPPFDREKAQARLE